MRNFFLVKQSFFLMFLIIFAQNLFVLSLAAEEESSSTEETKLAIEEVQEIAPVPGESTEIPVLPEEKNLDEQEVPLPPQKPTWEFPPVIGISKTGEELRIIVEPNLLMDREKIPAIESVKLETGKGEFLGYKAFNEKDIKRRAEFLVDPKPLKIEKVKITVKSTAEGDWEKKVPLAETPAQLSVYSEEAKTSAPVPIPVEEEPQKPKKKRWFW